jgi:hypothetical protein
MADPITISALICSGIKIANSLNKFMDERRRANLELEALKARQEGVAAAQNAEAEKERLEKLFQCKFQVAASDIFFVLIVLGQRLITLEVVDFQHVPAFNSLVENHLPDEDFTEVYNKLDRTLKYTAAIGIFFCAECYPMHIYRGFGAAVLNNFRHVRPLKAKSRSSVLTRVH